MSDAIGLAIGLIAIDRGGDYKIVSTSVTGGASAVQQILTTTAASLLSLTLQAGGASRPVTAKGARGRSATAGDHRHTVGRP